MEKLKTRLHLTLSDRAIGELMLAKAALEKKNEQLNIKDTVIRELGVENRMLKAELEDAKKELDKMCEIIENEKREFHRRGVESVIEDAVQIIAQYEKSWSRNSDKWGETLVGKILACLESKYGLEVLDGPKDTIDPEIHEVIEVVPGKNKIHKIVQLSRGYRIGMRVIMPVRLRVIEGGHGKGGKRKGSPSSLPALVLVEGGNNRGREPEGAA